MPLQKPFVALLAQAAGYEVFVSPTGNDAHAGGPDTPVLTLSRAQELVRQRSLPSAASVRIAPGFYALQKPLLLSTPADSGVVWQRWIKDGGVADHWPPFRAEEDVIVSGGVRLGANGEKWTFNPDDKAWEIDVPPSAAIPVEQSSLFLNDVKGKVVPAIPLAAQYS